MLDLSWFDYHESAGRSKFVRRRAAWWIRVGPPAAARRRWSASLDSLDAIRTRPRARVRNPAPSS